MYYGWVIRRFVGKKRVPKYFTRLTSWKININSAYVFANKEEALGLKKEGDQVIPVRLEIANSKYWLQ